MSYDWLNDYVGLPYELGARGPEKYDCYGLLKKVYAERYNVEVPDWSDEVLSLRLRSKTINAVLQESGTWKEVDAPTDGDVVVCYRAKAAHHLGLYYNGGVLHALEGIGVVYEPMPRFRERFTRIVFGEWYP